MRKTAPIVLATLLALMVRPLQLPAASCILSNAPSEKPCKMHCCANKACCSLSEKNNAPASVPLYQGGVSKQVIGFVSVPVIGMHLLGRVAEPINAATLSRSHAPPPLAATCIRLI